MVKEFLLGDNPFIGVSHLAQLKARTEAREATLHNKIKVITAAKEGGATGFTFSTHESNLELLSIIKSNNARLINDLNYYILVPYVEKYVRRANVLGTTGLFKHHISKLVKSQLLQVLDMIVRFDPHKIINIFINQELYSYLKILPRSKIKAILLHEVVTELIMSYNLTKLLLKVKDYVEYKLGIGFGLETRNIGQLCDFIKNNKINIEYIMTPLNPIGYQMAPNKEEAEKCVSQLYSVGSKVIAINILASGAVKLEEAINYLTNYKKELYAVTSASTKPNRIYSNFKILTELKT